MAKKYDVVAVTGKYTDAQGDEKSRYLNIGVILTTKKGGFMLKLESVPIGWDGWAYLNEPKAKEDMKPAPSSEGKRDGGVTEMDDDIPWR